MGHAKLPALVSVSEEVYRDFLRQRNHTPETRLTMTRHANKIGILDGQRRFHTETLWFCKNQILQARRIQYRDGKNADDCYIRPAMKGNSDV